MARFNFKRAAWAAIALLCVAALGASADEQALRYGPREFRYEGVKEKPVFGFGIELLSALVDYRDAPERVGDRLHIRFYLKQPDEVHIVVRELDYDKYYWLDKAEPRTPWKAGFDNVFDWPTNEVVRPLGLRVDELGVVARLGVDQPSAIEKVAPALFYQSQFPTRVTAYVFHFKVRESSELWWNIYPLRDATAAPPAWG